MFPVRDLLRMSRGLRFRLTAGYALFFTLLLIGMAVMLRVRLDNTLREQERKSLEEQWGAMKGYLRIEKEHEVDPAERAYWYDDQEDPDEIKTVLEIKSISLVADATGNVIRDKYDEPAVSQGYKDNFGIDPPDKIAAAVKAALASKANQPVYSLRWNGEGEHYLMVSGNVWNEKHTARYYVAIGKSLSQYEKILRDFTLIFFGVIPGAVILGGMLGVFMSGRALKPVKDVALAAQRISGSNLSLRIPTREAGDELDYLITTFNRMIDRLEASFQQMKQFSTDVSHELRTPITAIRGQLEVALFTAKTTDQYREAMFNALQDIDRLSQIVRALLLLSQAESGQLVLQKSRQDLCEIVQELADQFQIPAEEAGVHLNAQVPAECPAEVDRVQIERMITNLLSNALKFTPKGGQVRLSVEPGEGCVRIAVEDTGRGIATEYLPHIFDRFYRVPGSGTAPSPDQGLGLGLSFVAWIVKAHQGKIDVDSTPGEGTRFTITLPSETTGSEAAELSSQRATLA